MPNTDWFYTTPEAVLRAESALAAFREDRIEDIGAMLAVDYQEPGGREPLDLLIAILSLADRLADYGVTMTREHTGEADMATVIREAGRIVAEATINNQEDDDE